MSISTFCSWNIICKWRFTHIIGLSLLVLSHGTTFAERTQRCLDNIRESGNATSLRISAFLTSGGISRWFKSSIMISWGNVTPQICNKSLLIWIKILRNLQVILQISKRNLEFMIIYAKISQKIHKFAVISYYFCNKSCRTTNQLVENARKSP